MIVRLHLARSVGRARHLAIAVLALMIVSVIPATAQDASSIQATLEAALLTQADLPDGFTSQDGIITGSNFNLDQDAFDANNGQGIVSQVWQRQSDTGPFFVFDFRLLFPTAEDARNYLRDAEAVISERDASGLKKRADEAPIGDLHRLYTGSSDVTGRKMVFNNHLMTVGPMAAKVFVTGATGSGQGARRIAEAAAANMAAALEATSTPTPTPAPVTPGPVPSAAPGPDVSPIFEQILVTHVGPGVDAASCVPVKERSFAGELAAISCPIGTAGETFVLRQMDSATSLAAAFEPFKGDKDGPTGTCATERALEPRLGGGQEVGQLACYDTADPNRVFIWTDTRFNQIAWFVGSLDRPFGDLYAQFLTAGPVEPSSGPLPPVRTPAPIVTPAPTPAPTTAPTSGPIVTPGPAGTIPPTLSGAAADLATHVPRSWVGTCSTTTMNVDPAATAALLCTATTTGGTVSVTFQQFPDQDSMDAAYEKNVQFLGATRGSGPCSGDWPAENIWTLDQKEAGRLVCGEVGGVARNYAWTDDRLLILGFAESFSVSKDDLHQWWLNDSGPIG